MDLRNFEQAEDAGKPQVENRVKPNCAHYEDKKYPGCSKNVAHYFCEFCDRTSMHGFNLLVERGRTITERIYWTIAILAAIYLSVVLVNQAYQKWLEAPIVVTFATSETPIWDIPFPAVTICPEIKSSRDFANYTDLYLKVEKHTESMEEKNDFEYLSLVCETPAEMLNESRWTTDQRAITYLRNVSPDFENMIYSVEWLGEEYSDGNLQELFTPVLTSEGICYTFNSMDRSELFTDAVTNYKEDYFSTKGRSSEWSLEYGYSSFSDVFSSYPRRTVSAGSKGGLSILFAALHQDIDYICNADLQQGFKVILHHPAEVPLAELGYFFVPFDQAVVAAIKPKMIKTSDDLKHYKVEDRKCYFTNERNLKYFKIYSQQNCLVECLTNYTLQMCGCVEFYMARDNLTKICSGVKKGCIENAKATFLTTEYKYKNSKNLASQNEFKSQCNCLPSCTSLRFDTEYSQIDWEWSEYLKIQKNTHSWDPGYDYLLENDSAHLSQLVIFFKNMQFLTSERNQLKGTLDLFSDFGGLLGLFTGFTFISGFEVLYYLTLRLVCNVLLFGRHYWSGSKDLLEAKENSSDDNELEEL